MKVLVLNCGSSSIKYKLFRNDYQRSPRTRRYRKNRSASSFLKLTLPNGEKENP